jgi:AcrR family transcriptional regulator
MGVDRRPRRDHQVSKGKRTKQHIVAAALKLFREHGYEATTMRMVAEHAGVSIGNAYYYFESKDLLLQAFYREVHDAHVAHARPRLSGQRTLVARLRIAMMSKLDVIEPYHRFSALMFRSAADPKSPLNPFHPAGEDIRIEGEELFADVLSGSSTKVPAALAKELPNLLWTYSMGIVLYWIHDDSTKHEKTRRLAERSVDLIATAIKLSSNPLLRPFQRKVLQLLKDLQFPAG